MDPRSDWITTGSNRIWPKQVNVLKFMKNDRKPFGYTLFYSKNDTDGTWFIYEQSSYLLELLENNTF